MLNLSLRFDKGFLLINSGIECMRFPGSYFVNSAYVTILLLRSLFLPDAIVLTL